MSGREQVAQQRVSWAVSTVLEALHRRGCAPKQGGAGWQARRPGHEDRVAIERKTKADAYTSLGRERARFERELVRLARLDYAALVIECSLPEFLRPPALSLLNPRAAVASLLAWSVKHRVCVFFAGDRRHGRALTWGLLEKYRRYRMEERT